ncbi:MULTISPECIES: replication initiation protein RepM [Gammaproteobacteria]|jgi:plasmid replication initiation protein|uniref:RepB family plasmid replication initiator protein n=1 Tax=Acinetobacter cumulans TaxID=2136182 RepID=A0ABX9U325_9GAMM|nr:MULTISPECIES: replication initiation protein RepM [Gammaproteobacteria]RLL36899.1 RepB family plasmid replication initiator protein [Acinetobacter cumulans]
MKTELVVKDNALINASYNLDLVEQRLILLAIVEARESGKGINANDPLTVHAESYINQFGVHRNTAYQALKDACDDLFARQFSYQTMSEKGNVVNHKSRWVSEVAYIDNEAIVQLIFSPAIVPLITRLEEQFTKYEIQQISNLSSAYAVRLYEILIAWRSSGSTPIIPLTDFRKKIGVLDSEYKRMYDFKKYVLDIAIKQINEHTDITVKVEQHKTGRSITGFSFNFKQKKSVTAEINNLAQRKIKQLTDSQRHFFANKLSVLPEMGSYSQGTETFEQFAVRIAEMLKDYKNIEELLPYLQKVGFKEAS